MIHTLTKRGFKGFTLIELLVVIAIIGLLSTIIAAPIQNARKKARDSKKIAEVKAVQLALDQYAEANAGNYPPDLWSLEPTYMPQLPSFGSTTIPTVSPRDRFAYTPYEVYHTELIATLFAYHLGAHLENFSQGLDNDRDCVGAENTAGYNSYAGTSTCAFYPYGSADINGYYNDALNGTGTPLRANWTGGMITRYDFDPGITPSTIGAAGSVSDFDGSDNNTTACDALTDCVFDVTQQQ
ncbi:MAG: ral secretion pathway protein [Patescibacteria group bacterium]|nr:ral secretion pathway protein [Patescibacteria group bacterium]